MSRPTPARHRAACKPTTPLTTFGQTVAGPAGRRMAVVAASSGIVLTLTATASVAGGAPAPQIAPVQAANLTAAVVTDSDSDSLTVAPTVTVAEDAAFSFDGADVSSEPPPPPPPPPAPVVTTVERPAAAAASRDGVRDAAPQTEVAAEETTTEEAAPTAAPAASASGSAIVDIARRYIGTPYVHGGAAPGGFDCSGFTMYVFAQVGISLPRTSSAQGSIGTRVSAAEARPGDLVWAPGHVGIYTGNGQHIAARSPGTPLYESQIYMSNPVFIRVG